MYRNATSIHTVQIKEDQVKVIVQYVYTGEQRTSLPFPTEEVGNLGDAKGCFILWQRALVSSTVLPSTVNYFFKIFYFHSLSYYIIWLFTLVIMFG